MLHGSPEDLLEFAPILEGQELRTLHRNRTFTVEVEGGNLVFVDSKGNRRPHGGKYLRAVLGHLRRRTPTSPATTGI